MLVTDGTWMAAGAAGEGDGVPGKRESVTEARRLTLLLWGLVHPAQAHLKGRLPTLKGVALCAQTGTVCWSQPTSLGPLLICAEGITQSPAPGGGRDGCQTHSRSITSSLHTGVLWK